jgi:peptide/nickel transport system substrate-binding protein
MDIRKWRWGVGLIVLMLAVAAACGPAAEPAPSPSGGGGGSGLDLTPISVGGGGSSGGSGGGSGATPSASGSETSVSGIPLDPNAKSGGVLQKAYTQEGPTFSSWEEAAGVSPAVTHPQLNMLVRSRTWGTEEDFVNNAFFEFHPDLAARWEQSADGLQWTFHLRDGITWSDGTPVTCADAKWSYDTIRTGEGLNRSPRYVHFLAVDSIACPDDRTVVFNMKYPKPAFLEVVGMPYHVIRPKHIYENNTDHMRNDPPDGTTGPYKLVQWLPGEKYIFERNPDYWDKPFPYLDGIEMTYLVSTALPTAIRAGRLDIASETGFTGGQAETVLAECEVCVFWPRVIASSLSPALMLNHTRPPWNSQSVKDAFALAIDKRDMVSVAFQDWSVVPSGCGFYPTGPWEMPADRCKQIPGYNFDDPAGDKERARQILADAGYAPGDLRPNIVYWDIQGIRDALPSMLEDLAEVGIQATAEPMETSRAYATWTDGGFDIGIHSFWVAGLDPDVILYEQFYTGSDRNYNRYSNPEFDALVDAMSREIDPQRRKEMAWDAMETALRDQAKHILGHTTYVPAFNKRVQGLMPAPNYLSGYGPQSRHDHTWLSE